MESALKTSFCHFERSEKSNILNKNNRFLGALLRGGKGRPVFRHGVIPTGKEPLCGGKMTVRDLFRVNSILVKEKRAYL